MPKIIFFRWNKNASLELAIALGGRSGKDIIIRFLKWAWRISL